MEGITALGSITLVNIILSGDNSIIIAMASKHLPEHKRKQAIWWGSIVAVVLRIILTIMAAILIEISYLQFIGGIALLYIAMNLLSKSQKGPAVKQAHSMMEAIKVILVADVIMSLDNVLAIAGIANGNIMLLAIGLAMSIPIVIVGSQLLLTLMQRFSVVVYLGAAILGWTAAKMMVEDAVIGYWLRPYKVFWEIMLVLLVTIIGHWKKSGRQPSAWMMYCRKW